MHGLIAQIIALIGGGVTVHLNGVASLVSKLFNSAKSYHTQGIEFARSLGLSVREAQAYTEVLTERVGDLAAKYGVTVEKIREIQDGIVAATGKQYLLNDAEAEYAVQINKLIGQGTANQFATEMMAHMGGQLSAVQGAVSKVYATAAKSGLNAQTFSAKVAANLRLANAVTFKDGVDGITRMTALSEKLGFNMRSVANSMNRFGDLDKAIENSARLQMLGGNAAIMGGNPLQMAYEANYDAEAYTKRITDMMKGRAVFDEKSGMSVVNGMDRDFIKSIAEAVGMSGEELMSIAKNQAAVQYKESRFSPMMDRMNLSQEQRDYIINKSYVEDGRLKMNVNGEARDISNGIDADVLKNMMQYDKMSDKEILAQNAEQLKTIDESIKGIGDSLTAKISAKLVELFPNLNTSIAEIGRFLVGNVGPVANAIGAMANAAVKVLSEFKEPLKVIAGYGAKIVTFVANLAAEWPKTALAIIAAIHMSRASGLVGSAARGVGNVLTSTSALAKGASGVVGAGIGIYQGVQAISDYSSTMANLNAMRSNGAISQATYEARSNEARKDRNVELGGAAGTAIGSALGAALVGPIGAIIGGWLGNTLGKEIAKHWDDIVGMWNTYVVRPFGYAVDTIKGAWNEYVVNPFNEAVASIRNAWDEYVVGTFNKGIRFITETIPNKIGEVWDGAVSVVSNTWNNYVVSPFNSVISFIRGAWDYVTSKVSGAFDTVVGFFRGLNPSTWLEKAVNGAKSLYNSIGGNADGGIIGGDSYSGDKVLTRVNSGEMVLNGDQQSGLFNFIKGLTNVVADMDFGMGEKPFNGNNVDVKVFTTLPTEITAKPVGEKEYIYKPSVQDSYSSAPRDVRVNDFNISLNGTIKLDLGDSSSRIDTNALLNDAAFMHSLKEIIKNSINRDMYGGREMSDLSTLNGQVAPSTTFGR